MDKYKRALEVLKSNYTGSINNDAIKTIEELIGQVETIDAAREKLINLSDKVIIVSKELKHYKSRYEYYKHEWCAECERAEKLEKALDKVCAALSIMGYIAGDHTDKEKEWKEFFLKDE